MTICHPEDAPKRDGIGRRRPGRECPDPASWANKNVCRTLHTRPSTQIHREDSTTPKGCCQTPQKDRIRKLSRAFRAVEQLFQLFHGLPLSERHFHRRPARGALGAHPSPPRSRVNRSAVDDLGRKAAAHRTLTGAFQAITSRHCRGIRPRACGRSSCPFSSGIWPRPSRSPRRSAPPSSGHAA